MKEEYGKHVVFFFYGDQLFLNAFSVDKKIKKEYI